MITEQVNSLISALHKIGSADALYISNFITWSVPRDNGTDVLLYQLEPASSRDRVSTMDILSRNKDSTWLPNSSSWKWKEKKLFYLRARHYITQRNVTILNRWIFWANVFLSFNLKPGKNLTSLRFVLKWTWICLTWNICSQINTCRSMGLKAV